MRHSTLLNFDGETDALFTSAVPSAASVNMVPGRSGMSLRMQRGTPRVVIKLASLMSGRPFPGEWTVLTASICAEEDTHAALVYSLDGRTLLQAPASLPANRWITVSLDLTRLPAMNSGVGSLSLRFREGRAPGTVWLDDLMLLNNTESIVEGSAGGWSILRKGLRISIVRPNVFSLHLNTAESAQGGWIVEEANTMRARFRSNRSDEHLLTVYSDGRLLKDGSFSAASAAIRDDARYAAAHDAPADVFVADEFGRVDRRSPGDANNDGYDETLGAYCVVATGNRAEVTITPLGIPILRPVLQISGLPQGPVRVTVEGRLVEESLRLPDGQLIVVLPLRLERATTVSVRLQ